MKNQHRIRQILVIGSFLAIIVGYTYYRIDAARAPEIPPSLAEATTR